ncbi:MAG: tetratricopeptide repeat protein [Pseudomonadota bacterium]
MLRLILGILALWIAVTPAVFAQTDEETGQIERFNEAEALRRGDIGQPDPAAAHAIFSELADAGMARALDRVGYAHWRGLGAPRDMARAEAALRGAVIGGHAKSLVNLGRLLAETGRGPEAREVLLDAERQRLSHAAFYRASGDAWGDFGAASDPDAGISTLRALAESGDNRARSEIAELTLAGSGALEPDPARALTLFEELAAEGNALAAERAAYAYWRGVGTEPDLARAQSLYETSVAGGRAGARVNLARVLVEAGQPEAARTTLEEGVLARVGSAPFWLARGHFQGDFGEASIADEGLPKLADMAAAGDTRAATFLAQRSENWRINNDVLRGGLATLEGASAAGDGGASAALLELMRVRPWLFEDARGKRAALIDERGDTIREDLLMQERVALVADTRRGRTRYEEIAALLETATGDSHERGILQAFREDRMTYTYLLQQELIERGHYDGAATGRMTNRTILAFREFCRSVGIDDICTHGPLRTDAVRAVSEVIRDDA